MPTVRRWVWHRLSFCLVLGAVGVVLAVSVLGLAGITGSARAALRDAVIADLGGMNYVVQAGDQEVLDRLEAAPDLHPVSEQSGTARFGQSETPVYVRSVRDADVPLGALIDGRRPQEPTEVSVSKAAATELGVGVGDSVEVRTGSASPRLRRVVGLTANAANAQDRTVVTIEPDLAASEATSWLTNSDPTGIASLRGELDRRAATMRSASLLAEDAADRLPDGLAFLRRVPLILLGLLLVVAGGVLASFLPSVRRDVGALVAAGVTPARAWRLVRWVAAASIVVGELVGLVAVIAVLYRWRDGISGVFGHDWQRIAIPGGTFVLTLALTTLGVVLAGPAARRIRATSRTVRYPSGLRVGVRHLPVIAAIVGVLLFCGALAARQQNPPDRLASWAPIAMVGVAVALPQLFAPLAGRGAPPAVRAVIRHLHRVFAPVVAVALVMTVGVAGRTATSVHNASAFESISRAPQPPGSFLVTEIPAGAADQIVAAFREAGGEKVRQFDLPNERQRQLRVTGPTLVRCLVERQTYNPEAMPDACFPQGTQSPVNGVALARGGGELSLGDPGLVRAGTVGLMVYRTLTSQVTRIAETAARPDPDLGGNMPGLVVPPTGKVARAFDLRPSGSRLVALLDFGALPPTKQAQVRGVIARVGPAAQTADGTGRGIYDGQRTVAGITALAGGVLVLLILLIGGVAVAVGQRRLRRTLVDLGGAAAVRASIAARWCTALVAAGLAAVPLTMLGVRVGEVRGEAAHGVLWTVPFIGFGLGCLGVMALLLRVPARSAD